MDNYKGFEWDKGNIDKSYQKHGITPNEAEEAFLDEKAIVLRDVKHSSKENRYLLIGENASNKILLVAFTLRIKKIRIISARKANRKEMYKYVKKV
ncbi:MAG: BrnT family toxin [Candidatus Beckwithbacteria bacterium]